MKQPYFSLHVGINAVIPFEYGGWDGQLNACEKDLETMASLMPSHCKIRKLPTKNATRQNFEFTMTKTIMDANAVARRGVHPVVVFSYSGHGGLIDAIAGDEKKDSTFCFIDGMTRDNIMNHFHAMCHPNVIFVSFIDACNMGLGYKGADDGLPAVKAAPEFVNRAVKAADVMSYPFEKVRCTVVWNSGSPAEGFSYDGEDNGQFTACIKETVTDYPRLKRMKTQVKKIHSLMPSYQTPMTTYVNRRWKGKNFKLDWNRK